MSEQNRIERPFSDEPDYPPPSDRDRRVVDSARLGPPPVGRTIDGEPDPRPLHPEPPSTDSGGTLLLVGAVFVAVFAGAFLVIHVAPAAKPTASPPAAPTPTSAPVAAGKPPRPRLVPLERPRSPEEQKAIDDANAEADADAARKIREFLDGKEPTPGPAARQKSVDELFADLNNSDDEIVREAAKALAFKDQRVPKRQAIVFALISQGLKLPPETLKAALAKWTTGQDLSLLSALTKNSNADMRKVGVAVVVGLRDPRAADILAAALEDDGNRSEAAAGLKTLGKSGESAVWKVLGSPNPRVRREACVILAVVGSNASVPLLQARLTDEDGEIRSAAENAIATIGAR
jgi:hypothetical protein